MNEAEQILADLRAAAPDLAVFRPETCIVRTSGVASSDRWGGAVEAPAVETTYPCRFKMLTGREASDAARVASTAEYRVTLPLDAEVEEASTVEYQGRVYPVLALMRATYALETKLLLAAGEAA